MRDILMEMLGCEQELDRAAQEILDTMPQFREARQALEQTAREMVDEVGFARFDAWESRYLHYTAYELRVYYALGLGLRRELVRALAL